MTAIQTTMWRFTTINEHTGLSRSTVWRLEREGKFPKRIQLSPNCVGWKKSDVLDWLASRETV